MQHEVDHEAETAIFGERSATREQRLMVWVFLQAKDDLFKKGKGKKTIANALDALAWFTAGNERHLGKPRLFSFEGICEEFNLDPETVRRAILARYK